MRLHVVEEVFVLTSVTWLPVFVKSISRSADCSLCFNFCLVKP